MMNCDNCKKEHNRKRFCSNKCKDIFHNRVNPRGIALINKCQTRLTEDDSGDYASGWDEDGWRSDDSGCSKT